MTHDEGVTHPAHETIDCLRIGNAYTSNPAFIMSRSPNNLPPSGSAIADFPGWFSYSIYSIQISSLSQIP